MLVELVVWLAAYRGSGMFVDVNSVGLFVPTRKVTDVITLCIAFTFLTRLHDVCIYLCLYTCAVCRISARIHFDQLIITSLGIFDYGCDAFKLQSYLHVHVAIFAQKCGKVVNKVRRTVNDF